MEDMKQYRYNNDSTHNYLTSTMSTTSGLGSNYTTNTTSGLSASSLSTHPNTSSPCRKCGSSSYSDENIHSLVSPCSPNRMTGYLQHNHNHHHHQPQARLPPVQSYSNQIYASYGLTTMGNVGPQEAPPSITASYDTDLYFNNSYTMERCAYGGSNTPELIRSPYNNARVPQMGVSASGHRRTLSNNVTGLGGYCQTNFQETAPPDPFVGGVVVATSKNPFLAMSQPQNHFVHADMYDRGLSITDSVAFEVGKLRSSLKKKTKMEGAFADANAVYACSNKDNHSSSSSSQQSQSRVRFSPMHSFSSRMTQNEMGSSQ